MAYLNFNASVVLTKPKLLQVCNFAFSLKKSFKMMVLTVLGGRNGQNSQLMQISIPPSARWR